MDSSQDVDSAGPRPRRAGCIGSADQERPEEGVQQTSLRETHRTLHHSLHLLLLHLWAQIDQEPDRH